MLFETSVPQRGPLLLLVLVLATLVPSNCQAVAKTDYLLNTAIQSNTAKATQTAKPTKSITEADAADCVDLFWPANAAPNLRKSLIKHTAERMRSGRMNQLGATTTAQVPVETLSQGGSKKRKTKPAKRPHDQPYSTPNSNYEGPAPHRPYNGPGPRPDQYDSPSSFPYRGRDYPDDYPGPGQEPYGQDGPRRSKSNGVQEGGPLLFIDNSRSGGQNGRLVAQSSMPGVTLGNGYRATFPLFARGGDDGIYGDWDLKVDLEHELLPTGDRSFFTVTGPEDCSDNPPPAPAPVPPPAPVPAPAPSAAAAFALKGGPDAPCDLAATRMTIWGRFYNLERATTIVGDGYYPGSFTFDVRPTICMYKSPSGHYFRGDVVNVTPNREITIDELVDGSWSAGLTLKVVCDNFCHDPVGNSTWDVPYISQAKASACVDSCGPTPQTVCARLA